MRNASILALLFALLSPALGCKATLKTNQCTPNCAGRECGDNGCGGVCGRCGPGTSCSPTEGLCVSAFCGNGRIEPGEACDNAIAAGPGACISEAECGNDGNACTTEQFFGTAVDCSAECTSFIIRDCVSGDGCCPGDGCAMSDSDCSLTCGNGMVEAPLETCDGDCPVDPVADCPDDGDACTTPVISGMASVCSAQCTTQPVTECIDDDGCCAPDCGIDEDNDCEFVCGDGLVTGPELCDNAIGAGEEGACPTAAADCDDQEACTTDAFAGDPALCMAACTNVAITMPINGDGCCPPGATSANDDDCVAVCGNMLVEGGETCDNAIVAGNAGACPVEADCDDMDACTTDTLAGDAALCTAECVNTEVMTPVAADGCCYFAGTVAQEIVDCQAKCDSYCTQVTTFCTEAELGVGNALFNDDNMSGSAMDECQAACAQFQFTIRTPAGVALQDDDGFNTMDCRLYHLTLADPAQMGDPVAHCPHALEVSAVCNNDP